MKCKIYTFWGYLQTVSNIELRICWWRGTTFRSHSPREPLWSPYYYVWGTQSISFISQTNVDQCWIRKCKSDHILYTLKNKHSCLYSKTARQYTDKVGFGRSQECENRVQAWPALIIKVHSLLRCAYFWAYTVLIDIDWHWVLIKYVLLRVFGFFENWFVSSLIFIPQQCINFVISFYCDLRLTNNRKVLTFFAPLHHSKNNSC